MTEPPEPRPHPAHTSAPDPYTICTDPAWLDRSLVHRWLSTDTYWATGRSRERVERAIAGSLNFGVYDRSGAQIGYARVVTDHATFAWLADVYVDPAVRGRGVASALVTAVRAELAPLGLSRIMLATRDAQPLYARLGFRPLAHPERFMVHGAD